MFHFSQIVNLNGVQSSSRRKDFRKRANPDIFVSRAVNLQVSAKMDHESAEILLLR